jgi:hypothetical protein
MSGAPLSAHQSLRQDAWRRTWDRLLREPSEVAQSLAERVAEAPSQPASRPIETRR